MANSAHDHSAHDHSGHMDHSAHMDNSAHGDHAGHDMTPLQEMVRQVVATTMATMAGSGDAHQGHDMRNMDHTGHNMGPMDHSSMAHTGHSGMDGMDHGSMDHGSMGHGMMMWFHGGYEETVLFDSWKFSTIGGLIGSMIGIFFMAALYEGLKYYREYLFWKTYNALQYRAVSIPAEKSVVTEDNQIVHISVGETIVKQPPTMWSWMHGFQTFLHIIQMVLSYFLMLIFMTYNVWLCVAVVLGAAVGYFLFGWKKSVIVDVTEHCH